MIAVMIASGLTIATCLAASVREARRPASQPDTRPGEMTMSYYNRNTHRRQSRPASGPRANRYAGPCATCGDEVPADAGLLTGGQASGWTVKHRPAEWSGSPVSGWYAGGCPRDTAKLNASGKWGPESARTYVPDAPRQAGPDDDLREVSRRAGSKYAYTASGARMTMSSRRCEDVPCCGCC